MTTPEKLCWKTSKDIPSEASLISHQLMLRAGLITKLASGIYTWLPMGLRVLKQVESVIRTCMEDADANEILMPVLQPGTLWQETSRWQAYGAELMRLEDRHERAFCLGPTHEEVITDWARHHFNSYRQLPACVYQIQTKFRDEIRPRFGVMRAREFLMKDAYSFHISQTCLDKTYLKMQQAYCQIFNKLGLTYRMVDADSGSIGGKKSHEFQVISQSGEDALVYSSQGCYAANIESATAKPPTPATPPDDTAPSLETVTQTSDIQVVIVKGSQQPWVMCLLRQQDTFNPTLAQQHELVASPLEIADQSTWLALGSDTDPTKTKITILADHFAMALADFITPTQNAAAAHCHWYRDIQPTHVSHLRCVQANDPSPIDHGHLNIERGIEVGHIFQLGTCYSAPMQATVQADNGQNQPLLMGCYGIGVSRLIAASIEQHHDQHGIVWPKRMAPFDIHLIGFQADKKQPVQETSMTIYQQLTDAGYRVLLDLRTQRPGVLLADADLLGLPWRIVVSERSLANGGIELKARTAASAEITQTEQLIFKLQGITEE